MIRFFLYSSIILWTLAIIKESLFWFYLWQVKNYHLPRFLAHFQTYKGKKLIYNKLVFTKLILGLFLFILSSGSREKLIYLSLSLIFLLYLGETIKLAKELIKKELRYPVFTSKVKVLTLFFFASMGIYLGMEAKYINLNYSPIKIILSLILFDLLLPLIVSLIVFIFQPITIILREKIINRAIAKRKKLKNLLVIGITGSYGKSSTKEFLSTILSQRYKVVKTEKNKNSEFGLSRTILNNLKLDTNILVAEMGAYCKGGIKLLSNIAQPKIGILTGINQQHLATFGSQKNIINTKYELIKSLPPDGLAIFNGDNKFCRSLYQETKIKKRIISTKKTSISHWWSENTKIKENGLSFEAVSKNGERIKIETDLLGEQNIPNLLLAICCAKETGIADEKIKNGILSIKQEEGSIIKYKGLNGVNIIDSSYSSNSEGVIADLDYLKINPGQKIIIMPCIIELDGASSNIHFQIGQKIGQVCDLAIITTKDQFGQIKKGAEQSGSRKENIVFIDNPVKIMNKLKLFLNPDTTILLEGRVPQKLIEKLRANPKSKA